jgi:hypothetical protein
MREAIAPGAPPSGPVAAGTVHLQLQEADMTSSKPDDLIRSESVKLTEEELGKISGGAEFLEHRNIKVQFLQQKHKDA